jgi:hypothetical protein
VETENPSAYGTVDCKSVWNGYSAVSVITRGCNQCANKIQSSELEPVINITCTPVHVTVLWRIITWSVNDISNSCSV